MSNTVPTPVRPCPPWCHQRGQWHPTARTRTHRVLLVDVELGDDATVEVLIWQDEIDGQLAAPRVRVLYLSHPTPSELAAAPAWVDMPADAIGHLAAILDLLTIQAMPDFVHALERAVRLLTEETR
ncbi:hypothetical protein [Streptosporangium sp. KLBMP 9127]|nr:hypothetical protein [Streptosporangium sp. KLBMP 9127]